MTIRKFISTALTILLTTVALAHQAKASDLLADACVADTASSINTSAILSASSGAPFTSGDMNNLVAQQAAFRIPRLTCEDLAQTKEMISLVRAVILPAVVAIERSGAGAQLAEQILALELSNPAVLGVTVIGAAGISFFNIVLKVSEKECERQNQEQLKSQIFQEIRLKYGIQSSPSQKLEFQPN